MTKKVRTGDVFQRTEKGPNYIALGKAIVDGSTFVIACRNGNINKDGQARAGHSVVTTRRAKLGKKGTRPTLYAFKPTQINQIHNNRSVNIDSVWSRGKAETIEVDVRRMNKRRGVKTEAKRLVD